jgi:hypothetical protein
MCSSCYDWPSTALIEIGEHQIAFRTAAALGLDQIYLLIPLRPIISKRLTNLSGPAGSLTEAAHAPR